MRIPAWRPLVGRIVLLVAGVVGGGALTAGAEEKGRSDGPAAAEQQAIEAVRRFTTNLQFHKDGSVRLARFSKPAVTDATLQHLQHFPRIDYLAVVCPQVTDRGLSPIGHLRQLDTLLLSGSGITDAGLAHLVELDKLQRLYLADTQVTDAGLVHLAGLTSLDTLSLNGTSVSDNGLRHLAELPKLEFLLLADTRVTDTGLQTLGRCTNLRGLYLTRCAVTGAGLQALRSLKKLEVLGLTETQVDDRTVSRLASLQQLKQLEMRRVPLTESGWKQLRAALPAVGIAGGIAGGDAAAADSSSPSVASKPGGDVALASGNESGVSSEQPAPAVSQADLPPIRERLAAGDETPDFQRHVVPLLGRLGCNGRACHGSFQGQGGFRLSMFGYDFALDLENLHERIDLERPGDSLLLNKPTSEDDHGGGLRLPPGEWQQDLLRRWIAAGAAGLGPEPPRFERLEVTPAEVIFDREGETAQLQVVAVWSDGTREDVTELTRFQSNDETIAEVSADGLIGARGQGDTYVISFYDNGIFSTQVLRPFADRGGQDDPAELASGTPLDQPVLQKLQKLGIRPAPLCDDAEFLRRVSLDMIGTLPTPEEIEQFLADAAPDKRARKIDELLDRPAYVTWWTTRLCDLTGSNAGYLGGTEMAQPVAQQWRDWIERRVRDNAGWDRIVRGIVLASSRRPGQTYAEFIEEQSGYTRREDPADFAAPDNVMPHFWFRSNIGQPAEKALAFGYSFLGVRLDCAQCHKHPYDQWSQRDFELFTEFFTRIKTGVAPDAAELRERTRNMLGVPVKLNTAALRRQSYLRIAAEGRPIPWKEVYVEPPGDKPQPARLLGGAALDLSHYDDPRRPLMEWLLEEPNRTFAKAFVNRIWAHYFHVGIIDPPDDLNQANPPSNKGLLDYLVEQFVARGYDIKWLHRAIANSHTYQRSWRTNSSNRSDERNFSRAVVRRLPAEVAIDAVLQATASDAKLARAATDVAGRKIGQHPKSFQARAIDFSLLVFGKPLRTTNCDCERRSEPTLLQALYLRNDTELLEALRRPDGWLAQLRKQASDAAKSGNEQPDSKQPETEALIRAAYLRTLSRAPTDRERADCHEHIEQSGDRLDGLQDVLWALLNTQEFITNH